MTPYIVISIIAVGMLGVAMPLALHWDRQQKNRRRKHSRSRPS